MELWKSGDDYLASLATKLKKQPPTLLEQVGRMLEVGYLEVSRKEGNMTYYRPARALLEYLSSTP
jgi:DNA-binding transcriptional ArsR family regulator